MRRLTRKEIVKPNLIPILDSVFIFIFFLLMSAQFLEIYEIGSDAPMISSDEPQKDKKPPLNLSVEIRKRELILRKGIDNKVFKKIAKKDGKYNLEEFGIVLSDLKNQFPKEESIIIKPSSAVKYDSIVRIVDASRMRKSQLDSAGKQIEEKDLFGKVIFDTSN
ncbi:MAG: hypothetical protein HOE90_23060 [Bacteriovoracaceae bacterium]|jgi:biopolymer transport protein ExbD|nr:hypothetical protein [Bacteriovoracaceae bacterium]